MSTLTDAFEVRYSTQRVLEWTTPDDPNASAKDATRLAAAGTDAEERFDIEVGAAFDETDAAHIQAAIPGVRAFLLQYMDQGGGDKAILAWVKNHLKPLSMVTGRDRIMPATNSNLIPSAQPAVKPAFDRRSFWGLQLDNPGDQEDASTDGSV